MSEVVKPDKPNYYEVVNAAIDAVVETDEYSGVSYLQPRYRQFLREQRLYLGNESDPQDELYEILKLEVEMRNAKNDQLTPLLSWINTVVNETIKPEEEEQTNELMKNLLEYMKLNEEVKQREKDIAVREVVMDNKEKLAQYQARDYSFAERDRKI